MYNCILIKFVKRHISNKYSIYFKTCCHFPKMFIKYRSIYICCIDWVTALHCHMPQLKNDHFLSSRSFLNGKQSSFVCKCTLFSINWRRFITRLLNFHLETVWTTCLKLWLLMDSSFISKIFSMANCIRCGLLFACLFLNYILDCISFSLMRIYHP